MFHIELCRLNLYITGITVFLLPVAFIHTVVLFTQFQFNTLLFMSNNNIIISLIEMN